MSNMLIALQITALGMGLVFAAILLLWWMMNLLTSITAEKDSSPAVNASISDSTGTAPVIDSDLKAQIAAVAVAIALAEQQASSSRPLSEPPTAIVSAWQLGTRTRQLYEKRTGLNRK